MQNKLYSIQLAGINCTNCQNKIKNALNQKVKQGLLKTTVVILQQKVNVLLQNQAVLYKVIRVLEDIGYQILGQPLLIQGGDANIRSVSFLYQINNGSQKLEDLLRNTPGVVSISRTHIRDKIKINICYNNKIVKGRQLADTIEEKDPNFQTINHRVQSFKSHKTSSAKGPSMKITGLLCAFFLIFDMFLPLTGHWFMNLATLPKQLGPYAISVLLNLCVSIYTLNTYAKPIIKRSYRNYFSAGGMDMQTLISLGCISAFFLFCFFMMKYSIDFMYNKFDEPGKSIMEINDSLASSSIIVLVVTIGKNFEKKVKNKIQSMTNQIFPQSKLFENMMVTFARLKNRKLKIEQTKQYDVTLLEKDDIFTIKGGNRLLLDSIVLLGQFDAIKSTVDGNDEVQTLTKGDRVESGSIVVSCAQQSLLQVQNVFEDSILIQIGTHIKLGQNQQQNNESGIQALCKNISRYFVKSVIMISLLVMASWFFLLSFNYVTVPGCNFCWIVQRGIGVLVASCPCALGLAVPSVVAIVLNIAIKNGILIKNSGVLQKMKKCKIISFDKTGTLFTRINKIQQYHIFSNDIAQSVLWEIITVIEKPIKHPIAEILYKQAFNRSKLEGTNFSVFLNEKPVVRKQGLQSQISIKGESKRYKVLIGNRRLLQNNNVEIPSYNKNSTGVTELYLALDNKAYMVMVLNTHSNLRPEAVKVIELLMKNKTNVHILSGDSKQSVAQLGKSLNLPIQNLHPEHSSHMKMQWIQKVQTSTNENAGIGVIMVGDGLNDIPCLQEACIGISINAKSQLNINASDIIMLTEDLYKILALVKLLQKGNLFININLFWAFAYNLAIMPVVAGLFYGINITISPVWSSIAMSCSSVIVVGFSHLLSFFEYDENKKNIQKQNNKYVNLEDMKSIVSPQNSKNIMSQKFEQFNQQS